MPNLLDLFRRLIVAALCVLGACAAVHAADQAEAFIAAQTPTKGDPR